MGLDRGWSARTGLSRNQSSGHRGKWGALRLRRSGGPEQRVVTRIDGRGRENHCLLPRRPWLALFESGSAGLGESPVAGSGGSGGGSQSQVARPVRFLGAAFWSELIR